MKMIKEKIKGELQQIDGQLTDNQHSDLSMQDLDVIHKLAKTYYYLLELEKEIMPHNPNPKTY